MKKVLVIGGSYFVGRVFVLLSARSEMYELHVLNRGSHPFRLNTITQHVSDRHDAAGLRSVLPEAGWDAVVDFCAYEPGDCESLLAALPGAVRQYILISTCSVYGADASSPKGEDAALTRRTGDDPGTVYARNKILLEEEAAKACAAKGCALTLFRPTIIYGPFNYAPRESYYFDLMLRNEAVPHPVDASGRFSFVYVKDVAAFLGKSIGNEAAFNETFNLAAPEAVDYASLLALLERTGGRKPLIREVTVSQVAAGNIPLPFSLDADELFSGHKAARILGHAYTSLDAGMKESFESYKNVFGNR